MIFSLFAPGLRTGQVPNGRGFDTVPGEQQSARAEAGRFSARFSAREAARLWMLKQVRHDAEMLEMYIVRLSGSAEKADVAAGLVRILRRISLVLAIVWSLPVGLAMLWAYAVTNNGGPLWAHPAFLGWIGIALVLIATFVVAAALSRLHERR